ncbi:MOSC domain-containing protein [Mycolicibacterium litorale]|uniref:MOSC domain-containing protein n=1 Tax=Mycolicibacterium litorale TaxID=758802 RepID=UPI003CE99BF2
MPAEVVALYRHPVKSMWGEDVDTMTIVDGGVLGDRVRAFEAVQNGERITAKKHGAMLNCRVRYLTAPSEADPAPPIEVTMPDGSVVRGESDALTARVSDLLGVEVRLAAGASGSQVDLAPVHIVAAGTLRWLAAQYPAGCWAARRFRPNIVIDDGEDHGAAEDRWLGCDLHIGDAVLHVSLPTPRCVMTTRGQGDVLPHDRNIMRTMTRVRMRDVPGFGERPSVGVYADVVQPGIVQRGDAVRVMSA